MIGYVSTILGFSLMMFLSSVEGRSTSMHSNPPRSGIKFLVRNFFELFGTFWNFLQECSWSLSASVLKVSTIKK